MEKTRPAFENAILDSVLRDFDDVPPSESVGHEFSPEFELKAQKLMPRQLLPLLRQTQRSRPLYSYVQDS